MEKLVYLLSKDPTRPGGAFADTLLESVGPALASDDRVHGLTIEVPDLADDPRVTDAHLTGRGREIGGAVSVWLDRVEDRVLVDEALSEAGAPAAGYLVTESMVQPYAAREWPDGEKSPGVTQFVVFEQPNGLPDAEFFERWHGRISPMSFDLHPTRTRYVRNVVARRLTKGAPNWRAIVSERWDSLDEWLDPAKLYSSPGLFKAMQAVGFAEPASISLTLTSEWILKSGAGCA